MLSENDKFLILNTLILLIKKKEISNIEIARVLVLTNIDNQKLLSDNYKNIEGYNILSNGVHQRNGCCIFLKWKMLLGLFSLFTTVWYKKRSV